MEKETAIEIRDYALSAITDLNSALNAAEGNCEDSDYESLKKTIGILIGNTHMDILCFLYEKYPEIDDTKNHNQ